MEEDFLNSLSFNEECTLTQYFKQLSELSPEAVEQLKVKIWKHIAIEQAMGFLNNPSA